ncbi:hypothetical protein LX32DRAFT_716353 [Colletotrichum zoysiae]|uniref:Uncharacterized protein n=1 Tax=Colletotrichum zoysiae TaxID=1216348 RepID=A0AAD9H289_9PEZI|nr:hypothetical protein LX32DRAFT_716353 [Colletotrichum zoysiae]
MPADNKTKNEPKHVPPIPAWLPSTGQEPNSARKGWGGWVAPRVPVSHVGIGQVTLRGLARVPAFNGLGGRRAVLLDAFPLRVGAGGRGDGPLQREELRRLAGLDDDGGLLLRGSSVFMAVAGTVDGSRRRAAEEERVRKARVRARRAGTGGGGGGRCGGLLVLEALFGGLFLELFQFPLPLLNAFRVGGDRSLMRAAAVARVLVGTQGRLRDGVRRGGRLVLEALFGGLFLELFQFPLPLLNAFRVGGDRSLMRAAAVARVLVGTQGRLRDGVRHGGRPVLAVLWALGGGLGGAARVLVSDGRGREDLLEKPVDVLQRYGDGEEGTLSGDGGRVLQAPALDGLRGWRAVLQGRLPLRVGADGNPRLGVLGKAHTVVGAKGKIQARHAGSPREGGSHPEGGLLLGGLRRLAILGPDDNRRAMFRKPLRRRVLVGWDGQPRVGGRYHPVPAGLIVLGARVAVSDGHEQRRVMFRNPLPPLVLVGGDGGRYLPALMAGSDGGGLGGEGLLHQGQPGAALPVPVTPVREPLCGNGGVLLGVRVGGVGRGVVGVRGGGGRGGLWLPRQRELLGTRTRGLPLHDGLLGTHGPQGAAARIAQVEFGALLGTALDMPGPVTGRPGDLEGGGGHGGGGCGCGCGCGGGGGGDARNVSLENGGAGGHGGGGEGDPGRGRDGGLPVLELLALLEAHGLFGHGLLALALRRRRGGGRLRLDGAVGGADGRRVPVVLRERRRRRRRGGGGVLLADPLAVAALPRVVRHLLVEVPAEAALLGGAGRAPLGAAPGRVAGVLNHLLAELLVEAEPLAAHERGPRVVDLPLLSPAHHPALAELVLLLLRLFRGDLHRAVAPEALHLAADVEVQDLPELLPAFLPQKVLRYGAALALLGGAFDRAADRCGGGGSREVVGGADHTLQNRGSDHRGGGDRGCDVVRALRVPLAQGEGAGGAGRRRWRGRGGGRAGDGGRGGRAGCGGGGGDGGGGGGGGGGGRKLGRAKVLPLRVPAVRVAAERLRLAHLGPVDGDGLRALSVALVQVVEDAGGVVVRRERGRGARARARGGNGSQEGRAGGGGGGRGGGRARELGRAKVLPLRLPVVGVAAERLCLAHLGPVDGDGVGPVPVAEIRLVPAAGLPDVEGSLGLVEPDQVGELGDELVRAGRGDRGTRLASAGLGLGAGHDLADGGQVAGQPGGGFHLRVVFFCLLEGCGGVV